MWGLFFYFLVKTFLDEEMLLLVLVLKEEGHTMKKFILLIAMLFSVSCAKAAIELSEEDGNKQINALVGQEYVIKLPANATTGYSWKFISDDADKFEVLEEKYIVDSAKQGMVGAGGQSIYKIRLIKKGELRLQARYFRPWEGFNADKDKSVQWYFVIE